MNKNARLLIDPERGMGTISKNLYGYFSEHLGRCIYEGTWVGEGSPIPNTRGIRKDIVEALRALKIPVLRWPGGLFADTYHWMDGIGPRESRQPIVNIFWGGEVESNQFGTHEFFDLCSQLECAPYVAFNMGSGSVEEMVKWLEYITYGGDSPMARLRRANGRQDPWKLKYVGIGNEAWGGGGRMLPEHYANEFRRYSCYCRSFSGDRLYKVACGPYGGDTHWTEVLMKRAGDMMNGLSLHYYTERKPRRNRAMDLDEASWFEHIQLAQKMDDYLTDQDRVMSRFDPRKRVGLIVDEWGISYDPEEGTNPRHLYQQSTMLDALTACIHLNTFNLHNDRVQMANLAQTINVIQAVLLTDGPRMIKTPTYHVMQMFLPHHQAERLDSELKTPVYEFGNQQVKAVTASVSRSASGEIFITLGNCSPNSAIIVDVEAGIPLLLKAGSVLTDTDWKTHNTFNQPHRLEPIAFSACETVPGGCRVVLPAQSVVSLSMITEN